VGAESVNLVKRRAREGNATTVVIIQVRVAQHTGLAVFELTV
jgi:hypothetical protein